MYSKIFNSNTGKMTLLKNTLGKKILKQYLQQFSTLSGGSKSVDVVDEEHACAICMETIENSISCNGGHRFCSECISGYIKHFYISKYTEIRDAIRRGDELDTYFPDRGDDFDNRVNPIRFKCPHPGCNLDLLSIQSIGRDTTFNINANGTIPTRFRATQDLQEVITKYNLLLHESDCQRRISDECTKCCDSCTLEGQGTSTEVANQTNIEPLAQHIHDLIQRTARGGIPGSLIVWSCEHCGFGFNKRDNIHCLMCNRLYDDDVGRRGQTKGPQEVPINRCIRLGLPRKTIITQIAGIDFLLPDFAIDERDLNQRFQGEGAVLCFNCGAILNRNDGCDHMTCRCGYEFCYICGRPGSQDTGCHLVNHGRLNGHDIRNLSQNTIGNIMNNLNQFIIRPNLEAFRNKFGHNFNINHKRDRVLLLYELFPTGGLEWFIELDFINGTDIRIRLSNQSIPSDLSTHDSLINIYMRYYQVQDRSPEKKMDEGSKDSSDWVGRSNYVVR